MTLAVFMATMLALAPASAESPSFPGPGQAKRARVVIAEDPQAMIVFDPQPERIEGLVRRGLSAMTGRGHAAAAWRSLMSTQEVVGIKVLSGLGKTSGTRPAVVGAVIKGLLEAGFAPKQIVVWDKHLVDLRLAGFCDLANQYGVQVAGSADEGYDENTFYDASLIGKLVWGDVEFGRKGEGIGRKSFVSKLLTQRITRIINVTPLLNHNLTGVSGNLFGLAFGSVDNTIRFESGPKHLGEAVPEIYALPQLGDRVVLNIVDALICQYQGEETMRLHDSSMLRQLRFSTDPVALDVLSIDELNRQRELSKIPPVTSNFQIYTNASLLELGVSDLKRIDLIRVP
ncbi:MAG: DUF362 domain-containing protein [Verrucomicrobia bacterium]|nr:DUF362 domain-containing protein [Verrucomicrobiota bacterium]